MTIILKSLRASGLMTGLMLLGSAWTPLANAAGHCYYLGFGWWLCYVPQ
jgi:hypothetical protein